MRAMRRWMAGAVAAAALLAAAGCGGSTSGSGGGNAASIVPASAPVFVTVNTDLSSDQWNTVQSLLNKFPGKAKLLAKARESFEKDSNGVTWEDIKAVLGPEVDVAVLNFDSGTNVVGLMQPKDADKWDALVKKNNANAKKPADKIFSENVQGWTVFADTQAKVDLFKQEASSGAKLADDATYKDGAAKLPDSALVTAYANGSKVTAAVKQAFQGLSGISGATGTLTWIAADGVAENDGLKVDFFTKTSGATKTPAPYAAKLPNVVPAGALVYLSFNGEGFDTATIRRAMKNLNSIPQAGQFIAILKQLGPIFGHENAFYVRPGAGIPEITLVAQPDSPQQGIAAIDKLIATLAQTAGAPLKTKPLTVGSVKAKELNLGRFSIYYGVLGGKLVVTDAQQAFQDLQAGGQKLAADPTFKEAQQAAGMPGQTNGFVYVNLKDSIPLIESLAQLGGSQLPADVTANLRPLRTLVAWASAKTGQGQATIFLEVK
jgi:hypothetical protein